LRAAAAATGWSKKDVGAALLVVLVTVLVTVAVVVDVPKIFVMKNVGALLMTMLIPPLIWMIVLDGTYWLIWTGY
jgi:hypothetical protein